MTKPVHCDKRWRFNVVNSGMVTGFSRNSLFMDHKPFKDSKHLDWVWKKKFFDTFTIVVKLSAVVNWTFTVFGVIYCLGLFMKEVHVVSMKSLVNLHNLTYKLRYKTLFTKRWLFDEILKFVSNKSGEK